VRAIVDPDLAILTTPRSIEGSFARFKPRDHLAEYYSAVDAENDAILA
jgi:hypothetical protein